MALSSRQVAAALVAVLVALAFLTACASAARPAPAASSGGGGEEEATATTTPAYLRQVYPAVVETVEMLLARLPAGPSPKGPGH
jgi:hypothetical protein|uniref:Uncharacterized protein n=1 Tax=Zea mays TaxID=4577 RepID=B6U3A3_MAIZE|nr:hypothetical protein [Zea mays]